MPEFSEIRSIRDFTTLIRYLRRNLNWPVDEEQVDDLAFDYTASELGLDEQAAVRIREIKQLRPVTDDQPWGIFWIDFEPKRLPVVVMRRILAALVMRKRGSRRPEQAAWDLQDLMFISATGEGQDRGISFAHFQETESGQPQLRTFSWDAHENHFYYLKNVNLEALRWPEDSSDVQAWRACWASAFRTEHRYTITTSQALAGYMARLASATRSLVNEVFAAEQPNGPLHKLYASFKRVLIHDLSVDDFADMYAQTVTYGLFSAYATPHREEFTLDNIAELIPATNPFLRELFAECVRAGSADSGEMDLDELGVGELMDLLRTVDMQAILQDFGRQTRGEDPVIHFYESFLREYDAEKKAKRGVFYTPEPVVKFIVNSVDYLLRTEFDCPDGLADTGTMEWNGQQVPKVQILDPATGTGTFLVEVIKKVWETFYSQNKNKSTKVIAQYWNQYVSENLLPRIYGFELMMAPYSVAHLKIGLKLKELGYRFESAERLRVFLTNALQPAYEIPRVDSPTLAHEAENANHVKEREAVTVIIGNPPYSVNSSNQGEWVTNQIKKWYYPSDQMKEHNPKMLLDDYVKFIRFSETLIKHAGIGVLGFITNHGFLDNPTFRRMRFQLIETFNKIYVLDLHGNKNKKEVSPDGSTDDNVFDIQQGVSICLFLKSGENIPTEIFHCDMYGDRVKKYSTLMTNDINSLEWEKINPVSPFYLFTPQDEKITPEFYSSWPISKIFPLNVMGIKTNRDGLLSDFEKNRLIERISELASKNIPDEQIKNKYELEDGNYWNTNREREKIRSVDWKKNVVLAQYRPFDYRWLLYQQNLIEIGRGGSGIKVMKHFINNDNIGLVSVRQVAEGIFNHAFVSKNIVECRIMVSNKGAAYFYPLYIYNDNVKKKGSQDELSLGFETDSRIANISKEFIVNVEKRLRVKYIREGKGDLKKSIGPEDIFYYIYAMLNSSSYRERFNKLLKIDYPTIPVTKEVSLFSNLSKLGRELSEIHLLEITKDWNSVSYQGRGDNTVLANYPKHENGCIFINPLQYFHPVQELIWGFRLGGYQVCHKWLKDRRGRQLSAEDISHYKKIIVVVQETIRLMGEIDAAIEEHGGWPIQ